MTKFSQIKYGTFKMDMLDMFHPIYMTFLNLKKKLRFTIIVTNPKYKWMMNICSKYFCGLRVTSNEGQGT